MMSNKTLRDRDLGISVERKDHEPQVFLIGKAGTFVRLTLVQAQATHRMLGELLPQEKSLNQAPGNKRRPLIKDVRDKIVRQKVSKREK